MDRSACRPTLLDCRIVVGQILLMAFETPAHLHPVLTPHIISVLDFPVAFLTFKPGGNVPAVIKEDEVGKVMDLVPTDGSLLIPVFEQGRDSRFQFALFILWLDLKVAVHTRRHGRYRGKCTRPCPRVAIEAIDLELAGVKLVTKRNWLLWLVSGLSVRRPQHIGTE